MTESAVPVANAEDDDDVVVALETARVSAERDDIEAAVKWLHRAASAARRQGRPNRAGTLSRSAASLGAKFERKEEPSQVLSDITEDDFNENTIVDSAAEIAAKNGSDEPAQQPLKEQPPAEPPAIQQLDKPTPVAPLASRPKAAPHQAIRVAVKKALGGTFEARPLTADESPAAGEAEAFLVPIEGGKKLS